MGKPADRTKRASARATWAVVAGLVASGLTVPVPAHALAPTPWAGSISRTATSFRRSLVDAGRSATVLPDGRVLFAGVAGGDFGLDRYNPVNVDDEFGRFGLVTTDFGGADGANTAAMDDSGRTIAAGWAGGDVALARYDAVGYLDRTFGTDGRVVTDLGGSDDAAYAEASQAGGGTVVAAGNSSAMVLLRYRPDGTLDPAFGTGGRVTIPSDGPARSLAVAADGSFLLAGGGPAGFHLAKVTAAGSLDRAFGTGGTTRVTLGAPAVAAGLAVLPDGRISVGGSRGGDVALVRLLPAGGLDTSFGVLGAVITDLGGVERPHGLALAPDGGEAIVGEGGPSVGFIIAYRSDGSLDTDFSATGWILTAPTSLWGVQADPGGRWITAGSAGDDAAVRRWTADGRYPPTTGSIDWGDDYPRVQGAARQPDGRTVVVAETGGSTGLLRYRVDGSLDPTFGRGGMVVTDLISNPVGVVVQTSGRIVVAGFHEGTTALVAFRPDGSLDRGWGTDTGRTLSKFGDGGTPTVLNLLAGDALLIVVNIGLDVTSYMVRYTGDGRLDPTFGTGGTTAIGSFDQRATMVAQPDGKHIVAEGPALHRINADGTTDLSFGDGGRATEPTMSAGISAVAVLPEGKILLAVEESGGDGIQVARLNADGSRDAGWPPVSVWIDPNDHPNVAVGKIIVLGDGRFLVVSTSYVARFLPSGAIDQTFGGEGLVRLANPAINTEPFGNVVDAWLDGDGTLVAVGTDSWWTNEVLERFAIPRAGQLTLRGWGWNPVGELGTGDTVDRRTATGVAGLTDVVGVSAGVYHNLALRADGTVWAWGWNGVGQLGDGTTLDRHVPVQVPGLSDVMEVSAGAYHSLALKRDGTVWAWGWNGFGQLGDGTTTDRHSPVRVANLENARSIAAGGFHSLARAGPNDMTVTAWAWGWNGFGQLGDNTTIDRSAPVESAVPAGDGVSAIAAGTYHSLFLYDDGFLGVSGWNAVGQLGDGTTVDRHVPTLIRSEDGFTSISAGGLHSVASKSDGTVWAWGWNGVGQLGDGTTTDRHDPTLVPGLGGVVSVAAGLFHSAALGADGTVSSWGWNGVGQLGDGTTIDRHAPAKVAFVPPAAVLAAGAFHTLAR